MTSAQIKLIVFDIDGVLTGGETRALDLELLRDIRALNNAARRGADMPAVTLCTGRPAPYTELMLQAVDGHLPAVFENGAGLYVPQGYRFLPHPELAGAAGIPEVRRRLQETLVGQGWAYFQPGKEYSLTLFATDPQDTGLLGERTAESIGSLLDDVELVYSVSCLNILPKHIHKGKGIEFLAEWSGIDASEMLGIGDSEVDLQFLETVGFSAAPENAVEAIKSVVDYVSAHQAGAGVRDILGHFGI